MTIRTLSIGGAGGFELGLERAIARLRDRGDSLEFESFGFVSEDKAYRRMMKAHYPSSVAFRTINDVNVTPGTIDIICARLSARDISVAGKNQRVVPAPGLGFQLARIARRIQPQCVLLEAQTDVLTADDGRRLQAFLAVVTGWIADIPKHGWRSAGFAAANPELPREVYSVSWRRLDLRHFFEANCLTHRRERVYFVLLRAELEPRSEILLDAEDLARLPEADDQARESESTGAPDAGVDEARTKGRRVALQVSERGLAMPFVWRAGGFHSSPIEWTDTIPTIYGDNVAWAREDLRRVERSTPEEVERAFTFPDGWTAHDRQDKKILDTPRYRIMQSAVPPAIVEWIGTRLLA